MINFLKIRYFSLLLIIIFSNIYAKAAFLSNGFLVTSQYIDFKDKSGRCYGRIFYPKLSNENKPATLKINDTIDNFVKHYNPQCDKKSKRTEYKVNYDFRTGSKNYCSIKWTTKINENNSGDKLIKIESLNFNIADGSLLSVNNILSPLAKNFMPEIVKLSQNNLATDTSWAQFLEKVADKHIQFYILESNWYIVFNPNKSIDNAVVENKLPAYFFSK